MSVIKTVFKKWWWLILMLKCVTADKWIFIPNLEEEHRVQYNQSGERGRIYLDENVEENIIVVFFNHTGEDIPNIKYNEPSNAKELLGAIVEKNDKNDYWNLVVTKPQDYEAHRPDFKYEFEVIAGGTKREVFLFINNLDDEDPYIEVVQNPCRINENKVGLSDCYYIVRDADGVLNNVMIYTIIGSRDEAEIFEFKNEIVLNKDVKEWKVYLSMKQCLDYETRAHYLFQFNATDSGNNNGTARIIVEVNDLPDQPPVWTNIFSSKQFDEKTSQEFQVKAIDGDINVNYDINYDLKSDWPDLFSIDQENGIIQVKPINRDTLQREIFSIQLIAFEVPDPCWTTSQNATIIVNDINDNIPSITVNTTEIWMPENTVMRVHLHINIEDMDQGENGTYGVILEDETENKYYEAFLIVPDRGYHSMNFSISVINHTKLDYEDLDWQNLSFEIHSEEINTVEMWKDQKNIKIYLENLNDELPIFPESKYSACVCENIESDEYIATVIAYDRDIDDIVTHRVLGSMAEELFTIGVLDGEIRTRIDDAFDYERQTQVMVQVEAQDSLLGVHHTAVAQLTIDVKDVNDEQPQIKMSSEPISIEENQSNGTIINPSIKIIAQDPDTTARLRFKIDWDKSEARKNGVPTPKEEYTDSVIVDTVELDCGGYVKGVLLVNEIRKNNTPDYEMFDILYLHVIVEDEDQIIEPKTDEVRVVINIEDVNDNAPIFREETLNSTKQVTEHSPVGTIIATLIADDADGPKFNKVLYSIKPYNESTPDCVGIDKDDGQLIVTCDIDADGDIEKNIPPLWSLVYYVTAASEDLTTTNITVINVTDINDHEPMVIDKPYKTNIREDAENGTYVLTIAVYDGDRDEEYNTPWFRFSQYASIDVRNLFSVETHTGTIFVHFKNDEEFDRDYEDNGYTLPIVVSDNYNATGPGGRQNRIKEDVNVDVILLYINKEAPYIVEGHGNVTTLENLKSGQIIIETVLAADDDEPGTDNTRIDFIVEEVEPVEASNKVLPETPLFSVSTDDKQETGIGYITAQYDLEGYFGIYRVKLTLNDFGKDPGPKTSKDKIYVHIERYNFKPPEITFPENDVPIYLSRNQEIGTPLIQYDGSELELFSATDGQGEKWDLEFKIEKDSDPDEIFALLRQRQSKYRLSLNKEPNYRKTYKLDITAYCDCIGDEPLSSTVSTSIRFISRDSEPYFISNTDYREFTENTTDETAILPKAYFNDDEEEWLNFTVYYHLQPDTFECFELHVTERILSLKCLLDREAEDSHIVKVVASKTKSGNVSPNERSILTVYIKVLDINDNPPNFDERQYQASIKPTDDLNKIILQATATDLDLNDSMKFSMENLERHGNGLDNINTPFELHQINDTTVNVLLKFTVQPTMNGQFNFDLKVVDEVNHADVVPVYVYVVSDSSRTAFTFENKLENVVAKRNAIQEILESQLKYTCNIETIQEGVDEKGVPVESLTDVMVHFVDPETKKPIESAEIIKLSGDYETFTNLRNAFLDEELHLKTLQDDILQEQSNESLLFALLIGVSVVLGTMCISLITVFIIKVRSLKRRLNKLSQTTFGSQESGLNRMGIAAPNTNKHAVEGSNPVYGEEKNITDIDKVSIGSGDSDLIGIEDNPNFDYPENQEGSVNPAFKERFK
ncbi:hypothetical protein ILUMI_26351 [Ignelater luminosus]|uniref:Cadherin domain-containing protein n=1 Tax=Ignelater luminosus TaxID=2038154 RepID=A0A8K0FZ73_IGNLU|nr:hypothetical protein ILUMI_26351 [Ignelater luminosus]